MKKIFTLIATAFIALTASAFNEEWKPSADASSPVTLDHITAVFKDNTSKGSVVGQGTWTFGASDVRGDQNALEIDFTPTVRGKLSIIFAAAVAANKSINMSEDLKATLISDPTVEIANGANPPAEISTDDGIYYILEAGKTYTFYVGGTKWRLRSFSFTDEGLPTGGGDGPTTGGDDYTTKEIMDISSDAIQAKIEAAIANPIALSSPNFFIVSQDKKVYPVGTQDGGAADVLAADGEAITLPTYIWEHNSGNIAFKAVSTPNADAAATDSWQKKGNGTTEAMNVAGCEPEFTYYTGPKNGNPTASYKDYYEYNSDGDPVHRVYDGPYWEPGCGWVPVKGCFYEFTPSVEGSLKVALWVNKNLNSNPLYIVNAATMTPMAQNDVEIVGFMQNNTFEKNANDEQCGTNPYILNAEYKIVPAATPDAAAANRPFFGYFTFKVEAGTKYMIFSSKSQPGIFGYQFSHNGTSGISDIVVEKAQNDAIYNIAGQRVSGSAKGLVIKNGKKYFVK